LNLRRLFALAVAGATVIAAVLVCIVAAAFALYAVARVWLGPAGAAAVVAVAFAAVAAGVAAFVTRKVPPPEPADETGLVERLIELAKARPLVAAGAAAAVVAVLVRNPSVLTAIISAFLAGNAAGKPEAK
jgi:hypothetical protein